MNRRVSRFFCLLLALGCFASTPDLFARCGVERWSVKTGTDTDAHSIDLDFAHAQSTTIAHLITLKAPKPIPPDNRVAPTETSVFVVNATLTDYKLESGSTGDSDYHLVLEDDKGNTMVAEIPSPDCVASDSVLAAAIANARSEFDAQLRASSSFQTANIPVQVIGVGMFDFKHGQRGAAPNVIEIHPILDIVFNPTAAPPAGTDFDISLLSPIINLPQGGSSSETVIATATRGGAAPNATITVSGLPAGVNSHVTSLGNGKATIALSASDAAPVGSFPFTVTGTAGGRSHSQAASLSISAATKAPTGQQWEYQIVTATSDQDMIDKANQLGAEDWEMVSITRQGTNGWKAFFKRTKTNF